MHPARGGTVVSAAKEVLRRIPGAMSLRRFVGRGEHALALRLVRRQNILFTEVQRVPTQLAVLAGAVTDFLGARGERDSGRDGALRIVLFGCSIGAEPYSIAAALHAARPGIRLDAECFDIEPQVVERARSARYGVDEVKRMRHVTPAFIERTFDLTDSAFVVREALSDGVRCSVGDVLDRRLIESLAPADIVVAQNFLFHLSRADAARAFDHLQSLLKPCSALFIDGMDLDLRARLTRRAGLEPCAVEIEQIHAESRVERGYAWPRVYWGLEPFNRRRSDAVRRYATIFLRGASTPHPSAAVRGRPTA
jgi:chemotaxis methyl-accepting protein methylase